MQELPFVQFIATSRRVLVGPYGVLLVAFRAGGVSLQSATVIMIVVRIGPMLAAIMACARGQVLAGLAPVASTWHLCRRGAGVTCLVCRNGRDFPVARPPVPIQAQVMGAGRY